MKRVPTEKTPVSQRDRNVRFFHIGQEGNVDSDNARDTDWSCADTPAAIKLSQENDEGGRSPNHPGKYMGFNLLLQYGADIWIKGNKRKQDGYSAKYFFSGQQLLVMNSMW